MIPDLVIAENGRSNYAIVAPAEGDFAATQLRQYLESITGAVLPIARSADRPSIRLRKNGDSDRDRFAVRVERSDVVIEGANWRSILYGVYAFLETWCGARFFSPQFELVPQRSKLAIPAESRLERTADFQLRQIRLELSFDAETVDWAAKQGFNSITADFWLWEKPQAPDVIEAARARGLMTDASGHGMFHLLPAADHFNHHPEWFPLVNGQRMPMRHTGDNLCYANPQAVDALADNLLAFCRRFPQIQNVNLWPGDGGYICACPQCRAKPFMELYSAAIRRMADRVRAERPDLRIGQLAYNFDATDKTCPMMRVPPSDDPVPTMFAFWGQDLTIPLDRNDEPSHRIIRGYIEEFCRRSPGLGSIFSYHTDTYANSNLCPLFDAALPAELAWYKSLGVDELCLLWIPWNSESPQDMRWIAWQNGALWARLAMDLEFDGAAYRRDYHRAAFGEEHWQDGAARWTQLNDALARLCSLIFPFAPPRTSDAWGCAFSRDVLAWSLETDYGEPGRRRLDAFRQTADDLKRLQASTPPISDSDSPEAKRFKQYLNHCATRAAGLALIFQAQYAMHEKRWPDAADLLQAALQTGMVEERALTAKWLDLCRQHQTPNDD